MDKKLNAVALGLSAGSLAAVCMLLLSIGSYLGLYKNAAAQMMNWHMFYSLSLGGTIAGMIEAFLWSFVGAYLLAWFYNKFAAKK